MIAMKSSERPRSLRSCGVDGSARAAVKAATDAVHERLDAELSDFDLADPREYGEFLLVHALALPGIERALKTGNGHTGFAATCPGWNDGLRAGALLRDLEGMGLALPPPLPIAGFPVPPFPIAPLDGAQAWGAAYVLEGSRMGARVLARRARAGGASAVRANMRFLAAPSGLPWPRFLALMEVAVASTRDRERAIRGARAAFAAFSHALGAVRAGHAARSEPRATTDRSTAKEDA